MTRREGGRGAVLLMALATVVFLCAMGTAALTMMLAATRRGSEQRAVQQALVVAENGLEYAVWRLASDPAWPGEEDVDVPMGTCTIRVDRPGGATAILSSTRGSGPLVSVLAEVRLFDDGGCEIVSWSEDVQR